MSFAVLHVCTGNVCRSPMAEVLMRSGLAERLGEGADQVVVASAGTASLRGLPMEPFTVPALAAYGAVPGASSARDLAVEHLEAADLVLTATRQHRAAAVRLLPRASARTFTVREFGRLCEAVDPAVLPSGDLGERGRALVRAAAAQRGQVLVSPGEADVEDPYRGPASAYAACAQVLHDALQRPMDLLAGRPEGEDGRA